MEQLTTLTAYNFSPYITTPTRIIHAKATLIDHIFIKHGQNHADINITSGNILTDITDHLPNFALINDNSVKEKKNIRPLIRIYSEQNITKFKERLDNTDWNRLIENHDIDNSYSICYKNLYSMYNECFPLVRLSRKRAKDKKWLTMELKTSIKIKNKLHKKSASHPTESNISKYNNYRNELTARLRQAETL